MGTGGPIGAAHGVKNPLNARHRHLFLPALVLPYHAAWAIAEAVDRFTASLPQGLNKPRRDDRCIGPSLNDLDPQISCTPQCQQTRYVQSLQCEGDCIVLSIVITNASVYEWDFSCKPRSKPNSTYLLLHTLRMRCQMLLGSGPARAACCLLPAACSLLLGKMCGGTLLRRMATSLHSMYCVYAEV